MTIVMLGQKGLPARSGGIERHVQLLASGLVTRGHRVVVYGRRWYVGDARLTNGIEQRFTKGIRTKHLDAITHSFTALLDARKLKPEIIHIHGTGAALLAPLARLLVPRAKVVVTFHCIDRVLTKWNRVAKLAFIIGEWMACHAAHRLITVSQDLAQYCQTRYSHQATYVPHPFEMPGMPTDEWVSKHGLKLEQYILSVSRLIPDKQNHLLIDAYAQAKRVRPDLFREVPLVIVGGGAWTDQYVRWLTQKAADVPGVIMLGERMGEELRSLQAHALGHAFPTSSEGLSVSMVEAAAYSRPMVVTALPQNREVTGGHAIEVPALDVMALRDALIQMVELDELKRWSLGDGARRHVQTAFDYTDRVDDVTRVYQELVTGNSALVTYLPALA